MTRSDVDHLYEALAELRAEVKGYRADLNGRLKALELAEARRDGSTQRLGSVGKLIIGVAAVSASIGSVIGAIMAIA